MYVKKLNPKYVHLSIIVLILNRCFPHHIIKSNHKQNTATKVTGAAATTITTRANDKIEAEEDNRGWFVLKDGQQCCHGQKPRRRHQR